MKMRRTYPALGVLSAAALLFFGCGKPAEAPKAAAPAGAPAAETAPAGAVRVEEDVQALVTFVSGTAEKKDGAAWHPVAVGDDLPQDSTIKVGGASYCELQFGNTAVIRVHENTEVRLEKILLSAGANQVNVKLDAGSVLAKVSKLGGKDKFQVRTGTTICGVRGTEFGVSAAGDGRTVLKVRSGSVAVLPATADVEAIGGASADGRVREIAEAAAEKIIDSAPVVRENQEIVVTAETVAKTESLVKLVREEIAKLSEVPPEKAEEKDRRLAVFTEKVTAGVDRAMERPSGLSTENRESLRVIDAMVMLELPAPAPAAVAAVPAAPGTAPAAEPAAAAKAAEPPEKKTVFLTVSIAAVPGDAEILMNGVVVGKGGLSRIFPEGSRADFRVRRAGYETRDVSVDVKSSENLGFTVELKPLPKRIGIETDPRDADIRIDGRVVGKGRYAASFTPGETVKVTVSRAGFDDKTVDIPVTVDSEPVVRIALGRASREVTVEVEPRDARILLGEKPAGTGTYRGTHEAGERLTFRFRREGYRTESAVMDVKETGDSALSVKLIPEPREISVAVNPAASIFLDGKPVGRGSYRGMHEVGSSLAFTFRENGYADRELRVDVSLASPASYRVDLEARAVYGRFKASAAKIIGLASHGDGLVGSDADGRLFRAAADGKILWTLETANAGNLNSVPVVLDGRVYFSGVKELVVADAGSGSVLGRQKLDAASADAFGRRPAAVSGGILFPANKELQVRHPETGAALAAIPLGGGSMMSPLVHGGRIYIADLLGVIHVIDAASRKETATLATRAVNPVASAILISGGRGFLAGRRGDIAAFDPEKNALLWQVRLTKDSSAGVFHDLVAAGGAVYAFSKNAVYVLDAATGAPAADAVRDAAAPPVEAGGSVYVPLSDGRVARLEKAAGRIAAAADIGGKPASRPVVFRDMIAVGTENGEIVIVNPRGIR